jgi:hypothetical protein
VIINICKEEKEYETEAEGEDEKDWWSQLMDAEKVPRLPPPPPDPVILERIILRSKDPLIQRVKDDLLNLLRGEKKMERKGWVLASAVGPYLNLDDLNETVRNLNELTRGIIEIEEFKEQPTLSIGLKYKISPKLVIGLEIESMPESEVSGKIYNRGTSISQSINTIGGNLSFMSTISESKRHLLNLGIGLMYQEIKLSSNKDIELSDLVIKSTKGSASGFLLQGEFCLFPLGPFGLSIQGGYRLAPKIKLQDTMKADGNPITFDLGGVFYKGGLSWQF